MTTQASSASPLDIPVMPVAWLHDQPERYDVVHDEARALWLKAWPKQVEHYTIPLYRHAERQPLSTEAACALLKDAIGIDPILDGNMLKMLRAVERAHGIGHNARVQPGRAATADETTSAFSAHERYQRGNDVPLVEPLPMVKG